MGSKFRTGTTIWRNDMDERLNPFYFFFYCDIMTIYKYSIEENNLEFNFILIELETNNTITGRNLRILNRNVIITDQRLSKTLPPEERMLFYPKIYKLKKYLNKKCYKMSYVLPTSKIKIMEAMRNYGCD